MTQEEFDSIDFIGKALTSGLKISYNGSVFYVVGWDMTERLIGIREVEGDDDIYYKRCENCELL